MSRMVPPQPGVGPAATLLLFVTMAPLFGMNAAAVAQVSFGMKILHKPSSTVAHEL